MQHHLQWNDVGCESVRHRSDTLAQGIIFCAGASVGAFGLPHSPSVSQNQADNNDPHQERPSFPPSPSPYCSARVSHCFCPESGTSTRAHATYKQKPRGVTTLVFSECFLFLFLKAEVSVSFVLMIKNWALWGSLLWLQRLNSKAPVQWICSARGRITNAGQMGHNSRKHLSFFFFFMEGFLSS